MKLRFNFQVSRKMINFYTKFSLFFNIGVAIIIVLLSYSLLVGPKLSDITAVGLNDYTQEQQRLDGDKVYLDELTKTVTKYNTINKSTVDSIEKIIPSSEDLPNLFVSLAALANDVDMALDNVSFTEASESLTDASSQLKTLSINMTVSGGSRYSDVKTLLDSIEKNIRIIDIISVSFSLDEADIVSLEGANNSGTYGISARTYYLDEAVPTTQQLAEQDINDILQGLQAQ